MKICPSCGDEFQDWVDQCGDCEAALRPEHEMPVLAESAEGLRVASGSKKAMRRLSATLRAEGIPTRVVEESADLGLGAGVEIGGLGIDLEFDGWTNSLYVAPWDAARAEQIVELPSGESILPAIAAVNGRCPACGAEVAELDEQCPACSLALPKASSDGADEHLPELPIAP